MIDQPMNEEETARAEEATAGETADNNASGADGGDVPEAEENMTAGESAEESVAEEGADCLLYTSPSPRDGLLSRMPSSA